MGVGPYPFPFPDMHWIHSFRSSTQCVSHLLSVLKSDELGIPELDANNLPESVAQEIRIAFQPGDRRQPSDVFHVQFPQKFAVLPVANAKKTSKIIKLKICIKFVKLN